MAMRPVAILSDLWFEPVCEIRFVRRINLTFGRRVMSGRTTVLIAHRTSTVREADQIVVLKDGSIIESGTHDELLARGGYYADLYQKQLLEEELERA